MSDTSLPEPKIDQEKLEEYRGIYEDLLGFVPPRIQARTELLGRLDPEFLSLQEEIRKRGMYPDVFDVKTVQLMLFGMLLPARRGAHPRYSGAPRRRYLGGDAGGCKPGLPLRRPLRG